MSGGRLVVGCGATLLAATSLLACGSDAKPAAEATVETYATVPGAQVVSGLAATKQLMAAMVAAPATADQAAVDGVAASWQTYEGNIKSTDTATYLDAEDALALFSRAALGGDTAGMQRAADAFSQLAAMYTAAHPG